MGLKLNAIYFGGPRGLCGCHAISCSPLSQPVRIFVRVFVRVWGGKVLAFPGNPSAGLGQELESGSRLCTGRGWLKTGFVGGPPEAPRGFICHCHLQIAGVIHQSRLENGSLTGRRSRGLSSLLFEASGPKCKNFGGGGP